ncbi:MAG: membrane protein insertion efficiency factor YidD [Alphaproteobacteria bacterium]|nr:membrane protein insertion efficiency factor YidD [Alphaproteobacteria bacterium]
MRRKNGQPPMRETPRRGLSAVAAGALIAPIRFYRRFISPMFPPACRFEPTCSRYAIEAIEVHGPIKGAALALRRLLRCHPITWLGGSSGFDPVPPHKKPL